MQWMGARERKRDREGWEGKRYEEEAHETKKRRVCGMTEMEMGERGLNEVRYRELIDGTKNRT